MDRQMPCVLGCNLLTHRSRMGLEATLFFPVKNMAHELDRFETSSKVNGRSIRFIAMRSIKRNVKKKSRDPSCLSLVCEYMYL